MTQTPPNVSCPKCKSTAGVRPKLLLIDKFNVEHFNHYPEFRSGCDCQGQLSVDGLKTEFVQAQPFQQFISGLYCEACGVGFVPSEMAKPLQQGWKLSAEGVHPVNPDGSLGPAKFE